MRDEECTLGPNKAERLGTMAPNVKPKDDSTNLTMINQPAENVDKSRSAGLLERVPSLHLDHQARPEERGRQDPMQHHRVVLAPMKSAEFEGSDGPAG